MKMGRCNNYLNCSIADKRMSVPFTSADDICPECGGELQLISSKGNNSLPIFYIVLSILIIIIAGKILWDQYNDKNSKKCKDIKAKFEEALKAENVSEAEKYCSDIKKCPNCDCEQQLEILKKVLETYKIIKQKFEDALKAENISDAEKFLSEMKKLDNLRKCSDCEKRLQTLKDKDVLKDEKYKISRKNFEEALQAENISEAEKYLDEIKKLDNLKKCPDCEKQLEMLKNSLKEYKFLQDKFQEALKAEDISEAEEYLAEMKNLDNLRRCPVCKQQFDKIKNEHKFPKGYDTKKIDGSKWKKEK